jgi:hypothetical protein
MAKLVNTSTVYSYILTEAEWYGANDQQREAWIAQTLREADEFRCQYATILVEPDAVLSISPIPQRHQVWRHTFPMSNEEDFKVRFADVLQAGFTSGLTATRIRALIEGMLK